MSNTEDEPKKKRKKADLPIVSIKSTADYQRMKLDRLMANPEKPVMIPSKRKERNLAAPPDFVRNIMGSSAGAGSGEFHVYRHLRRKEYARQKNIQEQARKEDLELEFRRKVEDRQKVAEDKASKRKAKRLKKKAAKQRNRGKATTKKESSSSSSSSESGTEEIDAKEAIEASSTATSTVDTPVSSGVTTDLPCSSPVIAEPPLSSSVSAEPASSSVSTLESLSASVAEEPPPPTASPSDKTAVPI